MTDVIKTLLNRNEKFSSTRFNSELKLIPSLKTTIIGCVDPRVDPSEVFGLSHGEAVVLRNVGGRIFPNTFQTLNMLGIVAKSYGQEIGAGWNLVVLHHTDCGINCLSNSPELLAAHFGVDPHELGALAITDPYAAVAVDVAKIKANPKLPANIVVTGVVYDVATGKVSVVVPSAPIGD